MDLPLLVSGFSVVGLCYSGYIIASLRTEIDNLKNKETKEMITYEEAKRLVTIGKIIEKHGQLGRDVIDRVDTAIECRALDLNSHTAIQFDSNEELDVAIRYCECAGFGVKAESNEYCSMIYISWED